MGNFRRWYSWLLLGFIMAGCVVGYVFVFNQTTVSVSETAVDTSITVGPVLEPSLPIQLRIPSVGITSTFTEPLGLTELNTIEVPTTYDQVGWYQFGPTPGEKGPSVVLGHVDSTSGPAVFFSLGQLAPGDEIFIDRVDGSVATFVVTSLDRPRQSVFPTAEVYGDIDHAGLRLITCSGIFVRGQQQYTHNLIVYARLKNES